MTCLVFCHTLFLHSKLAVYFLFLKKLASMIFSHLFKTYPSYLVLKKRNKIVKIKSTYACLRITNSCAITLSFH